jgi:hypothetical protein
MQKKLSVLALVVVVATASFVAGTMFTSATAANTAANTAAEERIYVGAVTKNNGAVYIAWVENVPYPKYYYAQAQETSR